MKLTFSNPRLRAEFTDWPSGGKRVPCVFQVERTKRGWCVARTTTGKPKRTTYGGQVAVVDGSDGRTYILQVAANYGFIDIKRSDFMCATLETGRNTSAVFERDEPELHGQLMSLIVKAGSLLMEVSK